MVEVSAARELIPVGERTTMRWMKVHWHEVLWQAIACRVFTEDELDSAKAWDERLFRIGDAEDRAFRREFLNHARVADLMIMAWEKRISDPDPFAVTPEYMWNFEPYWFRSVEYGWHIAIRFPRIDRPLRDDETDYDRTPNTSDFNPDTEDEETSETSDIEMIDLTGVS
ncbi:hypothetical protein K490DRAFT_61647 [Saccharata proteae CBS 121410]|uniref:Uncharacterized protein n=1 Tax=Saccharata proteae CBS 121410 TaxID=1314787 RepID=A0A9P4I3S9_9PEZI|nr:hypothetical protein K490DRAFT_61647 [Saccharata proteae CBS 121410]